MNLNIKKLYEVSNKEELKIIGLMSGTSLDGLDVALCSFTGSGLSTKAKVLKFHTVPYTEEIKSQIRKVFAKSTVDFQHLCVLNPWIGTLHGQMVLNCLNIWGISASEIDVIASHGQTVYHAPISFHKKPDWPNATLQIGDGDHVAVTTGVLTISDFRQKHIAAGGEGAPLAVFGDYLIFSKMGETRILLNIGGIANFTYLPGNCDSDEVFSTDTGPGNTMLDACARKYYGVDYDNGGEIAGRGTVNTILLAELKSNNFFKLKFPKTAGPELFNMGYVAECQMVCGQSDISPEDLLTTLTRFSAETIADAILNCLTAFESNSTSSSSTVAIYHSGGGANNKTLMGHLMALLHNATFSSTETLGIHGDAKEAVLFATLANETLRGGKCQFGKQTTVPNLSLGKISFPN